MATRHNLCVNPALSIDATGWGGDSTPARTAVTGFDRGFAAHYTSGTFMRSAGTELGVITPGLSYTASMSLRSNVFAAGPGTMYLEWLDSDGEILSYTNGPYTQQPADQIVRLSVTGTAPAGASGVNIVLDGINFAVTDTDTTMALIEQSDQAGDYFDGDSGGASWDGTTGLSSSTLAETISGTLAGTLPAATLSAAGQLSVSGTLAGTVPAATLAATGQLIASGTLAGTLPAATLAAAVDVNITGALAGTLPAATLAGTVHVGVQIDVSVSVAPCRISEPISVAPARSGLTAAPCRTGLDVGPARTRRGD